MNTKILKKYLDIQKKYIYRKVTLEMVAREYGVTKERIRQVVSMDLKKRIAKKLISLLRKRALFLGKVKKKGNVLKICIKQPKTEELFVGNMEIKQYINSLPKNRKKETVEIKRTIAYQLRCLGLSYPKIAEYFSHSDHSTVMFWIKTYHESYGKRSKKK